MQVAPLTTGRKCDIGRYAGKTFNRAVVVDSKWIVMTCGNSCTVFDLDMFEEIGKTTWSMLKIGYVIESNIKQYLHALVLPNTRNTLSVDHINHVKTDNRLANLRLATQSEQNSNRPTRSDKSPACDELINAGIMHLPMGIRKDESMGRYTCGDHPICKKLKSINFTGTRCKDANELARFKDCLAIYIDILENNEDEAARVFFDKRIALAKEYNAIVQAAHTFDNKMPDGPYADIESLMEDDLTYAKSIMSTLSAVEVVKGPANMATNEIFVAALNAIKRTKGESVTMYDARFVEELKEINWDTGDGAPRVKIPSTLVSKYPDFERGTLMTFIWTQLLKKDIPEGHVVGPFTCDTYDVREENIQLIQGKAAFRITPDEWVIPEDVDIGMQFLPRGITVNKVKVMINQAGQLRPGEFGADAKGKWAKTITGKSTVAILINAAIKILTDTHGQNEFNERNDKYQKLMATYRGI